MAKTTITAGMTGAQYLTALANNFSQGIVIVSGNANSEYTSLNVAITAIGTIKVFKIESAITLTDNITIPTGCTLIIGAQGSIAGAYTLTGNNTTLRFDGINSGINTNVVFAGTWLCEKVTPEMFGAIGDAVVNTDGTITATDDQTPITKMFAFASLTREKRVSFGANKLYYSTGAVFQVTNLVIEGNNSKIIKDDGGVFTVSGSLGAYYELTGNAYKGDTWIKCTDAILLASLVPGDIVRIVSLEIVAPDSTETGCHGEMHKVRSIDSIDGIIYLNERLHWYYLLSDTAKVARVSMVDFKLSDISLISVAEISSSQAISLFYANVDIKNVFVKAFYYGINLYDCWKPVVSMSAWQLDKEGSGYGITAGGATMYADITFLNIGCRHSFTTTGANYPLGGIVWGCRVHDSIGFSSVVVAATPFDTHAASGSVYFDNCIAYGGILNSLVSSIIDWDGANTFHINDFVRSTIGHDLFKTLIENTNSDPEGVSNYPNWNLGVGNSVTGFKAEGMYEYYNNCKSFGCSQGFYIYGANMKTVSIRGCEVYDGINGIYGAATSKVDNLIVDGFIHNNKTIVKSGYAITMSVNYTYGLFNNIHVKNVTLINITPNSAPSKFEISNFSSTCSGVLPVIIFNHQEIRQCVLTNGRIKGTGNLLVTWYDGGHPATESIVINNVTCEDVEDNVIWLQHPVSNLIINGLVVTNPILESYLIAIDKNLTNLSISNSGYIGTNATKIIYTKTTTTLGKIFHNNNLFPNLTTFRTGTGALAAIECVGGSLGADRVLRGVGTPEGAITAPIGTQYLRSDGGANTSLYIKESGTGNTGWVGK